MSASPVVKGTLQIAAFVVCEHRHEWLYNVTKKVDLNTTESRKTLGFLNTK